MLAIQLSGAIQKQSTVALEMMNLIQDPPPYEGETPATGHTLFPLIPTRSIMENRESLLQGHRQGNHLQAVKEAAGQASTLRVATTCLRLGLIMIIPIVGS